MDLRSTVLCFPTRLGWRHIVLVRVRPIATIVGVDLGHREKLCLVILDRDSIRLLRMQRMCWRRGRAGRARKWLCLCLCLCLRLWLLAEVLRKLVEILKLVIILELLKGFL